MMSGGNETVTREVDFISIKNRSHSHSIREKAAIKTKPNRQPAEITAEAKKKRQLSFKIV